CAPKSKLSKFLYPTAKLMVKPTALQSEKRPPTQSHIGKILFSSIPNALTFLILVDTATKCLAIADAPPDFKNQSLMVFAFESVSCVVNVFETITNNVVSGFSFLITSLTWSPSILLTKWVVKWFL